MAYAENIDSALTSRAAIEALNVADRQIDLAWTAEGNKIEAAMARFKQNIDRIMFVGGTANEKHRWAVYYALVVALLAGYIMQSGGFGSSGFGMYAGF